MRLTFIRIILEEISKVYSFLVIVYCFVVIQFQKFVLTRSLGHSLPLLLAPAEGWQALQILLGPLAPSSLAEGAKLNMIQ